ncbi:hypothetical protein N7510_000481 [Penicillium lagena]|uniref:uncharacterized protein n=1 Tax=Penicillium lagena TaxID=94218 RepID=UPI002541F0C3|nr:uncharacterized protein N7510_000481 [Penicillium lagena]KAJ5624172.1 hypothetical protein N7510_000481 [Penicillium lagena]
MWEGRIGEKRDQGVTSINNSLCSIHQLDASNICKAVGRPLLDSLSFSAPSSDSPRPSCPLLRPPRIPPSRCRPTWSPSTQNPSSSASDDDVASLPSEATTDSDLDTLSDDFSDAEAEWRESLDQLELLLTMVLVPFVGKYLGRRCAYWGKQSWPQFLVISHTNQPIRSQVGRGTWNGNTLLKWSSEAPGPSEVLGSLKLLPLYDGRLNTKYTL